MKDPEEGSENGSITYNEDGWVVEQTQSPNITPWDPQSFILWSEWWWRRRLHVASDYPRSLYPFSYSLKVPHGLSFCTPLWPSPLLNFRLRSTYFVLSPLNHFCWMKFMFIPNSECIKMDHLSSDCMQRRPTFDKTRIHIRMWFCLNAANLEYIFVISSNISQTKIVSIFLCYY